MSTTDNEDPEPAHLVALAEVLKIACLGLNTQHIPKAEKIERMLLARGVVLVQQHKLNAKIHDAWVEGFDEGLMK